MNQEVFNALFERLSVLSAHLLERSVKNVLNIGFEKNGVVFASNFPEALIFSSNSVYNNQNLELDLICLNGQKREYSVLQKFGNKISGVKIVYAETFKKDFLFNKNCFNDIFEHLSSKGFKLIGNILETDKKWGSVFVNTKFFSIEDIKRLEKFSEQPKINLRIEKLIYSNDMSFYDYTDTSCFDVSIDVVIPTATKDFKMLKLAIKSIKKNILHNIENIYIIAPKGKIKDFCEKEKCIFVDEDTVLPIQKSDINYYPNGKSRVGWIYQQLLKLGADSVSKSKYILIADSDTVYVRPQSFIENGKIVLDCSDEYHKPYFEAYKKLIGLEKRLPMSFVAHHMFFDRDVLEALRTEIESKNNCKWYDAIVSALDINENSSFSEYETYANYLYYSNPSSVCIRYWHNRRASNRTIKRVMKDKKQTRQYKTVSVHTYVKNS